jgi:hypothetical protein
VKLRACEPPFPLGNCVPSASDRYLNSPSLTRLTGEVVIMGIGGTNAMMMATSSAAAISCRKLVEVHFDFPLGGFKNFNVTRADSTRDDNCRFPKERKC